MGIFRKIDLRKDRGKLVKKTGKAIKTCNTRKIKTICITMKQPYVNFVSYIKIASYTKAKKLLIDKFEARLSKVSKRNLR